MARPASSPGEAGSWARMCVKRCSTETSKQGKGILDTMVTNIRVAEETNNLLCQDTGVPIYNVVIGGAGPGNEDRPFSVLSQ